MSAPISILLAENNRLFRQLLIPVLEQHSIFTTCESSDGAQLLGLLKSHQPDVILLNIEIPDLHGSEVLPAIQKIRPAQKIIFFTIQNNESLSNYFYSKGACACLTKDADLEALTSTIRLVHENKYTPASHNLSAQNNNGYELKFSRRESEIIPLILDGKSNKQIADILHIGNKAVEAHKKNLYKKTKTQNVSGFVSYIFKKGLNYLIK